MRRYSYFSGSPLPNEKIKNRWRLLGTSFSYQQALIRSNRLGNYGLVVLAIKQNLAAKKYNEKIIADNRNIA